MKDGLVEGCLMTNLMNKLMNKLRNGLSDWELLLLAMFCMTMYTLAERGDRRVFIVYHSAMQLRFVYFCAGEQTSPNQ